MDRFNLLRVVVWWRVTTALPRDSPFVTICAFVRAYDAVATTGPGYLAIAESLLINGDSRIRGV